VGVGDEILAAGLAQRWADAHGGQRCLIIDLKGNPRWHPIWEGNPIIARPDDRRAGDHHLLCAPGARPYLVDQPMTRESGWHFNRDFRARDHIAKIYLTPEEWQIGLTAHNEYGDFILIEPYSDHPNLRWPLKHWTSLVESLPDTTFIQHVHQQSQNYLVPGAIPVMTETFRNACGLLSAANCYVRGESGMLHAAAALGVPSVAIWGECMDWDVLGSYPLQVGVGINPPACGHYVFCERCQAIMERIPPDDVANAISLATRWAGKVALQ
jgi:hypothetical protein